MLEVSLTAAEEYWKTRGRGKAHVHVFTDAHLYVHRSRSYKRKQEVCVKKFWGESSQKEVCRNSNKLQGV